MEKKDLLKFCRVFNDQKKNPYTGTDKEHIWDYEKFWIEQMMDEDDDFGFVLGEYVRAGLADFNNEDKVPATLKAILYNRFAQHNEMFKIADFKKWYKDFYLNL